MPLHYHEKPYLSFLLSGMYEEKSNSSTIIKTGTVLYREAHNQHANIFSNNHCECLHIEIKDYELFNLENNLKLPKNVVGRIGSIEIYNVLDSLKNDASDDLINIQCYEAINAHFDMLPAIGNPDWINMIKELIHDAPFDNLSLSSLAKDFNLHPNYIIRKFKEKTGYRLSEYLNKVRIEVALSKFLYSDENLTNIALDSGFYDQSHFIRNFKKHFCTTPFKLRNIIRS
ncbi:AraC family transcriptional regulator [uncultured Psychroserpens sp.]|uniref:helix-turn-helix domain-containing protein n=1 Tax=uncultured Psychroserpens sp. TaxID=255436 RepID=UPI002623CEAF|nr:AraC family transcriptional regulator [uncultured Psychroserpens sp.]